MRLIPLSTITFVSALTAASALAAAEPAALRGKEAYEQKILPLLQEYCFDCHADGVAKGDFAFDSYPDFASLRADQVAWDVVRQQVATHVMPPEKKPHPSLQQRDEIVQWIEDAVFWFDPKMQDPGHVTYRRLNRVEYNNTIRDALLVDLRPANDFPQDDTGYGFDNIGDVLTLSPILMEKYLRAAREVADEAMRLRSPEHANLEIGAKKFWNIKGESKEWEGARWFYNSSEAATKLNVPVQGTYDLVVKVAATQAGGEPARVRLTLNGSELGVFDVTAQFKGPKSSWQQIRKQVQLTGGENRLSVAFINDFSDPMNPDVNKRDRNLAVAEVNVDGPFGLSQPRPSRFLQWLLDGQTIGLPAVSLSGEDFSKGDGDSTRDTGSTLLASNGYVRVPLELAKPGKYRLVIKAGAQQAGDEKAKFDVRLGGKILGAFQVTAKEQTPQWFNLEAELPQGMQELQVWFLNDFYDEKSKADRNLWLHQVKVEGPIGTEASLGEAAVQGLIDRMGMRLFRRPLTAEEKTRWNTLAQTALKEGEAPLGALRYVLEGMLVSRSFLFRGGARPIGEVQNGVAMVDEYSLASRLAYFLWSAPPDERLMQLADRGELRKSLTTEVRRMLADWKAGALVDNFAGQWLQLRDMDIVAPDTRMFPEFKGGVASAMRKETEKFFAYILKENRSVIEFLNGDYTFLNGRLAKFYGISGVKGEDFQKVSLKGTPRAGVLTQGSLLTITSNPTRTSPVRRGKFLLENILGTPPPPAPGGVPPLQDDKVNRSRLTLRQQMEEHRSNPSCAGCHAFLDPIGLALENFDAIGRWRDTEKGKPIDATGHLVRGQEFKNIMDLREIFVRDLSGDFVRNLAENLLTYALGRGLKFSDKPAVQEIVQRAEKNGYRFQELFLAVCESVPFQRMKVEQSQTAGR